MYQFKQDIHRSIADSSISQTGLSAPAAIGTNSVSFCGIISSGGVHHSCVAIALDPVSSQNVLVSFDLVVYGDFSGALPVLIGSTVATNDPSAFEPSSNSAPISFDSVTDNMARVRGAFLAPSLDTVDDEVQYAYLWIKGDITTDADNENVKGLSCQMTAYSSEFDFWQPTK